MMVRTRATKMKTMKKEAKGLQRRPVSLLSTETPEALNIVSREGECLDAFDNGSEDIV